MTPLTHHHGCRPTSSVVLAGEETAPLVHQPWFARRALVRVPLAATERVPPPVPHHCWHSQQGSRWWHATHLASPGLEESSAAAVLAPALPPAIWAGLGARTGRYLDFCVSQKELHPCLATAVDARQRFVVVAGYVHHEIGAHVPCPDIGQGWRRCGEAPRVHLAMASTWASPLHRSLTPQRCP
jgi:hypothetical protein